MTFVLVAVLTAGAAWMHVSSKDEVVAFEERRDEVRQYFDQRLYLDVDEKLERLLDFAQFGRRATYLKEREESDVAQVSEARTYYERVKLDDLVNEAFAAHALVPAGRFGVSSHNDSPLRWFAHAAVHETGVALCLTLIVLLVAGMVLEKGWGHAIYLLFATGSILGLALVRAVSAPESQVPWVGSSGLATALLGAYLAFTIRGIARYYGGLISAWLLVPIWAGFFYGVIQPFWQPGFDHSLFYVHAIGAAAGFTVATVLSAPGLERRGDGAVEEKPSSAAAVIGKAQRVRRSGQADQAFELLRAEAERSPGDPEIVPALWELASELGQEAEAADAVMGLANRALRENRTADATKLWMDLVTAGVNARAEPLSLVRMGEALLDESHPSEAIAALRRATEVEEPMVSALALRIVKVARDLDPDLTRVAAALALADPRLSQSVREELELLSAGATSALGEDPVAQAVGATPSEDAVESGSSPEPQVATSGDSPAEAAGDGDGEPTSNLDPDALSEDLLSEFFASEEESIAADPDEIARWNDPGLVEDLREDSPDEDFDEDPTDSMVPRTSEPDIAEPAVVDTQVVETEVVDTAVQFQGSLSQLKIVQVTPVAFEDRGLVLEIEGRGKTALPYERVEAVAVGAVEGELAKAIIVVDLILNWTSFGGDDMRILRIRSDKFDPGQLVSAESPLQAMMALLDGLLSRTGATPLPDALAVRGRPFARFASLSAYEDEVLRGDPFKS